ncbi:hypothetical protein [Siminovitchia sp. 179-K 8D1 HS]|uniref:hypothetical protein n=1 Tax=Siminovitchia sp. 179-K 8D1 HS TaxID=3142385 RepID=UPI0039A07B48
MIIKVISVKIDDYYIINTEKDMSKDYEQTFLNSLKRNKKAGLVDYEILAN